MEWRWHKVSLIVAAALVIGVVLLSPELADFRKRESVFPASAHTISELFAIVVSILIFAIAWNAYSQERPGNIIIIACGFLGVGLLDMAHALSYKGMPDFVTPASPQKAIVFWLVARYLTALIFLWVAVRPWEPLRQPRQRYWWLALVLGIVGVTYAVQLARPEIIPVFFSPIQGLAPIKIDLEYGIIALLLVSLALLWRRHARRVESPPLLLAGAMTVLSEACFTLYASVNDIFSLLGHAYKVLAYVFIYDAIFVSSVREPFLKLRAAVRRQELSEQRIRFLAYHDPLTELPNRLLAREHYERARAAAGHAGRKVAVIFIDLDNFKQINDSLGHGVGDQLLVEVARRLGSSGSAHDVVSRFGGDEFLLLIPDIQNLATLPAILDGMLAQVQRPILVSGHELSTSISMGAAIYPDDGLDFDTLLQKADTAMYLAKQRGRNTYCFFAQSMQVAAVARLDVRNALVQAVARNEFLLYYQPQIDLASGRLVGLEALIRWQRPGHGLVAPAEFIAIAEECGLIVKIGDWVLRTACQQLAEWRADGLGDVVLAVNLSAVQFTHGDLEQSVTAALSAANLPPELLELELTESILIQDTANILVKVNRLRLLGIRLSIDDFGTGYSSLSYLKQFAVHKLKIDQSFVRSLASDEADASIVRTIILLARSFGLKTVAEGVTCKRVLDLLRELGCDEAQGYLISEPFAARQLGDFISKMQAMPALAAQ